MATYKIMRYFRDRRPAWVMRRELTLEEAQEHCSDESTHKKDENGNVIWFDGYTEE